VEEERPRLSAEMYAMLEDGMSEGMSDEWHE
jgi:hypothetical protein